MGQSDQILFDQTGILTEYSHLWAGKFVMWYDFPSHPICVIAVLILRLGIAPNSTTFIFGRANTDVGVAGYLAGSYIIIGVAVAENQRPALTGLLIGGALTDRASWRWWYNKSAR